jgi:hypothetical protein
MGALRRGATTPSERVQCIAGTVSGGAEFFVDGQNRRMSEDYERVSETGEAFIYAAMIRLIVRRSAHLCDFVDRF